MFERISAFQDIRMIEDSIEPLQIGMKYLLLETDWTITAEVLLIVIITTLKLQTGFGLVGWSGNLSEALPPPKMSGMDTIDARVRIALIRSYHRFEVPLISLCQRNEKAMMRTTGVSYNPISRRWVLRSPSSLQKIGTIWRFIILLSSSNYTSGNLPYSHSRSMKATILRQIPIPWKRVNFSLK